MYFSATRNTLKVFWIEWYENVVEIYKKFLLDSKFEKFISIYLNWVNWDKESNNNEKKVFISDDNYSEELKEICPFNKDLFTNHAKYRFFQDLCWVLNRNVLYGQDYINNNYVVWDRFNFINDLKKDKKYLGDITFSEIINIKYLIDEWYIKEISPWVYEVIEIDKNYIWKV